MSKSGSSLRSVVRAPKAVASAAPIIPIETVSATTYTLALADNGKIKRFTAANCTVTCPNNLPEGFNVGIVQRGAGSVTFVAGSGAIITNRNGYTKATGVGAVASLLVDSNATGTAARYVSGGDMQ